MGWRERWGRGAGVAVVVMGMGGCASPPSVGPLMAEVEKALAGEAAHLAVDTRRQEAWGAQQRDLLAGGFEADMAAQETLGPVWVSEAVRVYVAAREALLRHELAVAEEMAARRENLTLARAAQRRAMRLIQRQDELFEDVPDLRRWVEKRLNTDQEGE